MAVPKKRRSKSKKKLRKGFWKKKAELKAKLAYSSYKSTDVSTNVSLIKDSLDR